MHRTIRFRVRRGPSYHHPRKPIAAVTNLTNNAHAGPPLGETLQLLKPLALTLEKLDLGGNEVGGMITGDVSAYGKLTYLDMNNCGIGGACVCRDVPADRARKRIDV